jgi:hypothetical protein
MPTDAAKKFATTRKEDIMTMENYLKNMKEIIDQLEMINVTIPEDLIMLLMLHSLAKEY